MKKMSVIGAFFVLLSCVLVACGTAKNKISSGETKTVETEEASSIDKSIASSYIGDWVYDTGKGAVITFHINKGGIGSYEKSTSPDTTWVFSYEIKDEVLVLTNNAIGTTFLASYELSDDGMTLAYISGDFPHGTYSKIPSGETKTVETEDANSIDKSIASSYIGDWVYDTGKGNVITFHINKGGIGSYEQSTSPDTTWDFSYEIRDEVLVLTSNAIGTTFLASYELSNDGMTLAYISGNLPSGTYSKQ